MQFPFSLENSLTSTLAKLTPPHNKTPLQNQNYFPKSPPPILEGGGLCHAMLQRKIWNGIISSSVLKIDFKMQKCLKAAFFSHFHP